MSFKKSIKKISVVALLALTASPVCGQDLLASFLAYFRPTGQLDGNTEIIGLFSEQRDGETTTTCFVNLQNITLLHSLVDDLIRFRVLLVVSILAVLIDSAVSYTHLSIGRYRASTSSSRILLRRRT